jgi:hypothetical protein
MAPPWNNSEPRESQSGPEKVVEAVGKVFANRGRSNPSSDDDSDNNKNKK